jgi:hypothetical protein
MDTLKKKKKKKEMERFSNIDGDMVKNPIGGWVKFSEAEGTEQELKNWMSKHAAHPPLNCEIRKTGKCTCGLDKIITNPTMG